MSTIELTENPLYQRLRTLTVDVLDLVELVEALEEEFEVRIDDEELADIATVGEAYSLIAAKLS
jgi:acyl carrier protein